MKILIIEDQAGARETLRDILELNGHEVIAAEDGVQGVKLAAEKPAFIFCDVEMPNLDGRGVLAAIKEIPEVRDIPFVYLTASTSRSDQRSGMALGADDYITKPFTEADILGAIAARTKRHSSLREKLETLSTQRRQEVSAPWSHELLTPLNAVLGSLDLLETMGESVDPTELKEMLAFIRAGAERQERLARKLIRYFSLEQMALAPADRGRRVCAADLAIEEGATKAAGEADRTGRLKLSVAPAPIAVRHECLRDAVQEVVDNAFAFSPAGQWVTVTGTCTAGRYRIEVVDQGPGLSPEQRGNIGAFVQFDRQQREQQGLGIGLAIARATAQFAGGSLELRDGPGGRGLSVVFDLPLAPA